VLVEREKINDIRLAFKRQCEKAGGAINQEQFLPVYEKSLLSMEAAGQALQKRIVDGIRRI
jgi:hypothetical protein